MEVMEVEEVMESGDIVEVQLMEFGLGVEEKEEKEEMVVMEEKEEMVVMEVMEVMLEEKAFYNANLHIVLVTITMMVQ